MKYVLLIHHDEQAWDKLSEAKRQPILAEFRQLRQQLSSSGQYLDGAPLHPTSSATSVRIRNDKRLLRPMAPLRRRASCLAATS